MTLFFSLLGTYYNCLTQILAVEFPEVSNPKNSDSTDTHAFKKIDF